MVASSKASTGQCPPRPKFRPPGKQNRARFPAGVEESPCLTGMGILKALLMTSLPIDMSPPVRRSMYSGPTIQNSVAAPKLQFRMVAFDSLHRAAYHGGGDGPPGREAREGNAVRGLAPMPRLPPQLWAESTPDRCHWCRPVLRERWEGDRGASGSASQETCHHRIGSCHRAGCPGGRRWNRASIPGRCRACASPGSAGRFWHPAASRRSGAPSGLPSHADRYLPALPRGLHHLPCPAPPGRGRNPARPDLA